MAKVSRVGTRENSQPVLGYVGLGAVDGATGRPATNEGGPQKNVAPAPPSSLATFKAARGLLCDCVSGRFGASSGASCWPHSNACNACWPGRHGAAGIKALPNIGTTSGAQCHNYNGSTKQNLQSSRQNNRPSKQMTSVIFEPWKPTLLPPIIQGLLLHIL